MNVKQISVFLENKAGKLSELTRLLADNHINLRALSIADTQDFGILRLITGNPSEVAMILSSAGYVCNVTDVLAVSVDDAPGAVAKVLAALSDDGVDVEYCYAFVSSKRAGCANMILRVSDIPAAAAALAASSVPVLSQEELE